MCSLSNATLLNNEILASSMSHAIILAAKWPIGFTHTFSSTLRKRVLEKQ